MSIKLIQKHIFKGTRIFELFEDTIFVHSKSLLKEKKTTIALANIDPDPEIDKSHSIVNFKTLDKSQPILSFYLNKPDTERFSIFMRTIKENILITKQIIAEKDAVINAYSQRLTPPFSGLVQIAESGRARALTMDGKTWEFQHRHTTLPFESGSGKEYRHRFSHAMTIDKKGLQEIVYRAPHEYLNLDDSLIQLAEFISKADFPFPSTDIYEYWLLDPEDESPLAMIFSCSEEEQMSSFPEKTEWTALPSAAMPVELTADEKEQHETPVNRRVEQMVAERAGFQRPKARWFKRHADEEENFPPLLLTEDWEDENQAELCQRYLRRQSSRLLMLHGIPDNDRKKLEAAARSHVFEVERFYPFYPKVIDQKIMNAALVEARLRRNTKVNDPSSVENRRDGVLYQ
jgi:hypothetical protein